MAKKRIKNSKKGSKKSSRVGFLKKLKGYIFVAVVSFILGGFAMNSRFATSKIDDVYASMKEKYGILQAEPDYVEDTESMEEISSERNLNLTVDSDLRVASNVSTEDIETMLSGYENLEGLGSAFVEAEQTYGVNALYMVGLACLESGYGTSNFAKERNNLFGWCAYDSNPDKAMSFNSKEEAILYVASKLSTNYLSEDGMYFEGYSARAIDEHYCTDTAHADKIVSIVGELVKKLG